MCPTIGLVGRERTLANVFYLWMMLVSSLLVLIPALLLLLLLWALHLLAPCLESAGLVFNHRIGAHVASSSAAAPFLKTTSVLLMITSLLLVLLPLLGVLLLRLPLLWLCRFLCLPLIWGGRRWRACVIVIVPSRLLRLYVRLVWWLHLHCVYCWASWAHGCHLYLQRIYCGL